MAQRVIYEGSLTVSGTDFTQTVQRGNDYVEAELEGLDERIAPNAHLTFTLDYPFSKPYKGTVVTDAGASLRQIIDAIRNGFRVMYRGAAHEEVPNLANEKVDGDYGRAYHAIEDLVIERIDFDEETSELEIEIGS
ncbi:MAG: hypothetical protein IPQ07_31440 [Myxococcales bacterium]|nr:hypothetical protein [Myxococcales bacterium]